MYHQGMTENKSKSGTERNLNDRKKKRKNQQKKQHRANKKYKGGNSTGCDGEGDDEDGRYEYLLL